jgi:hypothetical protein
MGDNRGVLLAFSLLLFWVAGVCFFAAFHPGGVSLSDGSPAQNPADIIKWLMTQASLGSGPGAGSDSDTTSGASPAPVPVLA